MPVNRDAINRAAILVRRVYDACPYGVAGLGHVVLEDRNVRTEDLDGSLSREEASEVDRMSANALRAMLPLTQGERRAVLKKARKTTGATTQHNELPAPRLARGYEIRLTEKAVDGVFSFSIWWDGDYQSGGHSCRDLTLDEAFEWAKNRYLVHAEQDKAKP